ncbi:hypothetical protein [Metabacillus malikii]|uniref:Uncharacterized protein n=1 Tax=Metabacillus malikii TaxID=1504265 RepID=A0ABT9ZMC0_9BACI|nr:hypothetical protein [Metabacillus malikii]MDQ0232355.1 hypothetical protein [Metabacillus malikii]
MGKWIKKNRNAIPFIILLIIHIGMLVILLKRIQNRRHTIVLLLTNIGFAYIFETIVLNLFHAYRYIPKIFKNKFQDNIIGAIFSQAIYVPVVATFITIFKLNWKWKLFFTTYFAIVERIFIHLKIFKTGWWKTYYTFGLILVYFYISDMWSFFLKRQIKIVKFISDYMAIYSLSLSGLFIYATLNQLKIGFGVVHTWKEHFTFIPIYSLLIVALHLWVNKVKKVYLYGICQICFYLIDVILVKLRLIKNQKIPYLLFPYHLFIFYVTNKYILVTKKELIKNSN